MRRNWIQNIGQDGQSLLEVTVLVGLALITVSGLVIVTVNGLKNSQYSQNQAQATKRAQQGMDEVKSIASRNCAVNIGSNYFWFNSLNNGTDLVWGSNFPSSGTYQVINYDSCSSTNAGLTPNAHDLVPAAGSIFTRDITIEDDISCSSPASCKRVTVRVYWDDFSGTHESKLVTVLTEN